ncbi:unnamed protein product [Penicillium salamii]|uniref:ADP-ribose 1''-phosphate phosphatase n=1 Tax=Penicillium salamii TaxID=1612424 RepID=A0A9W4JCT3_9EURO|nr:unnamed protein product [Penicillium salamii]CAG8242710.1 unnamed protein product [Penicillium salamii]CAG8317698.1 unnamed protein product [Penicillium salamii]CAG8389165.1 unnamed protein product [Penicillium salamii]CAG8391774.1 unnamed protein product [Penicillium salamii]
MAEGTPDDTGYLHMPVLAINHFNCVHESPADLFAAPNGSALIRMEYFSAMPNLSFHFTDSIASDACNCMGRWGSGIATVFRDNYPAAFDIYARNCRYYNNNIREHMIEDIRLGNLSQEHPMRLVRQPLGTALVIPPQNTDIEIHGRRHWVVCLFVSRWYGSRRDSQADIRNYAYAALRDLAQQITELRIIADEDSEWPRFLFSNQFCSGLFRVPWEETRQLINEVGLHITVCTNSEQRRATQRHSRDRTIRRPSRFDLNEAFGRER